MPDDAPLPNPSAPDPVPDPTTRHDLRILGSLRQIIQELDVQSRRLAATAAVTAPQLVCLLALAESDESTARDLSRRVHVGTSTLVGVLDRLESKGLIERRRDSVDRRRVLIRTTERGRQLAAEHPSPFGPAVDSAFERLPEAERAALADAVARLAELIVSPGPTT